MSQNHVGENVQSEKTKYKHCDLNCRKYVWHNVKTAHPLKNSMHSFIERNAQCLYSQIFHLDLN